MLLRSAQGLHYSHKGGGLPDLSVRLDNGKTIDLDAETA